MPRAKETRAEGRANRVDQKKQGKETRRHEYEPEHNTAEAVEADHSSSPITAIDPPAAPPNSSKSELPGAIQKTVKVEKGNPGDQNEGQATPTENPENGSAAAMADNGDSSQSLDDHADQSIEASTTLSSHSRDDRTSPSDLPIRSKPELSDLAPEEDVSTTAITTSEVEESGSNDDSSERPQLLTSAEASAHEELSIDRTDGAPDGARGQDHMDELASEMPVITEVTSSPANLYIAQNQELSTPSTGATTAEHSSAVAQDKESDPRGSSEHLQPSDDIQVAGLERLTNGHGNHTTDEANKHDRANNPSSDEHRESPHPELSETIQKTVKAKKGNPGNSSKPTNFHTDAGSAELEHTANKPGNQVTNGANEGDRMDELARQRLMTTKPSSSPRKSMGLKMHKRIWNASRRAVDKLRQGVTTASERSVKLARRRAVAGLRQGIAMVRQPKRALGELLDLIPTNENDIAKFIACHPRLIISVLRAIEFAARGTLIGIKMSKLLAKAIWKVSQVSYTTYRVCSPPVAWVVGGILRYMRHKLTLTELVMPVHQEDDDYVGAVVPAVVEHWFPWEHAPSLADEIKALTRVGEHTRYGFGQSNHDKHPFSTIVDVPRPDYITNMQAFELYRDIQFRLEELGTLRRIPSILGAKFEVIPYNVQAIFSEPFANIDGQIIRSEDVWDFPTRGIDLPSSSPLSVVRQRNDTQLHTYVGVAISMISSTGQRNYTYAWFKQPTIQVEHREPVESMEGVEYTG